MPMHLKIVIECTDASSSPHCSNQLSLCQKRLSTPERSRRKLDSLLERLGKMVDIGESAILSHLFHRQVGRAQQILGVLNPQAQEVLVWRDAEVLAKNRREPGRRQLRPVGH